MLKSIHGQFCGYLMKLIKYLYLNLSDQFFCLDNKFESFYINKYVLLLFFVFVMIIYLLVMYLWHDLEK